MELNFGENIKRLRRSRDLTQEALADALGVSSQSVSKWECAYGYPDITQLPAIANFFGVTIDELLNNDKDGREVERKKFYDEVNQLEHGSDEQIEFICEYCRRYPDDLKYCYHLSNVLTWNIKDTEKREKYYSLFKSTNEKLFKSPEYKNDALFNMVVSCNEDELEEYLKMTTYSVEYLRRNCLISRYSSHEDFDNQLIHQGLSFIESIVEQLDIRYPDSLGPEKKAEYHKCILSVLRSFSCDGSVPDGWLAFYAYKQLVFAACLFGCGNKDEGEKEFRSAIDNLRRFYSITDEYLDMGGSMFGNLKMDKAWRMTIDQNGNEHELYGTQSNIIFSEPDYILNLLTNPRWAWFDSARNEEYYKDAVKWLEDIIKSQE